MTIDEATGLARFVITCEIINGDVLRLNRASAQIIVDETTGLRVPIDAIHYLKEDGTESETQGENYIPGVRPEATSCRAVIYRKPKRRTDIQAREAGM